MRAHHAGRSLGRLVLGLVVALFCATPLAAQSKRPQTEPAPVVAPGPVVTPMCKAGCLGTVTVSPDGGTLQSVANSGWQTATFSVGGTTEYTVQLTCERTGGITCGTVTPSSMVPGGPLLMPVEEPEAEAALTSTSASTSAVIMSAGQVTVQYRVGSTGGRLTLRAKYGTGSVEDTGSFNIGVMAAPTIALRNYNPDNHDRSVCLTSGAGESAAWQCGDLLVTHSMPGFTTLGQERSLALVYNSGTAFAQPLVAAAVTQGGSFRAVPSTVYTELWVNGVLRTAATYTGWGGSVASTRQLALDYPAAGLGTGVYPFILKVRNQFATGAYESSVSGQFLVVDRFSSEFGGGFALAGIERLYFNQPVGASTGAILWVGGDGSARLYTKLDATTWGAPLGGFQDQIRQVGTSYTRTLRHGVVVTFDSRGRHVTTTNRTGHTTTFQWDANADTLRSITVPPGGTGTTYTLQYANGGLDRIIDPVGRVLDVGISQGRLWTLTDPDGYSTSFGWDGDKRMTSRTGRNTFTTSYAYEQNRRVTRVTVPTGRTTSDPATAVTVFQPWDEKGLAISPTGQLTVDTAQAFTKILGPRANVADDATMWVDRWGAPTKLQNSLGHVTQLHRADPGHPAFVTSARHPNGRIDSMRYNDRGNLAEVRVITASLANGRPDRITRYTYNDTDNIDAPDTVTDSTPGQPGRRTIYQYDALGLTQYVRDPRSHVTRFYTRQTGGLAGVLDSMVDESVPVWMELRAKDTTINIKQSFAYGTLGNASSWWNFWIPTTYNHDAVGRVESTMDALGRRRHVEYDPMNRVESSGLSGIAYGLSSGCPGEYVYCARMLASEPWYPSAAGGSRSFWGPLGVDSVKDARGVMRHYRYDPRGLLIQEIDEFSHSKYQYLGPSGLLDSTRSRYGMVVRLTYDLLGRRTQLTYPDRPGQPTWWYADTSVTIEGDAIHTTYDNMSNVISSEDSQTLITRTYYPDGLLRTKVFLRKPTGDKDSLYYEYNGFGARSRMVHTIWTGGTSTRDVVDYTYTNAGDVNTIEVTWHNRSAPEVFSFDWDALGRRKQLTYPNGTDATYHYDPMGTLRKVEASGENNLDFAFRNRTVDRLGLIWNQTTECRGDNITHGTEDSGSPCAGTGDALENRSNVYSWSGFLVRQGLAGWPQDTMRYDQSGNLLARYNGRDQTRETFTVPAGTNRMTAHDVAGPAVTDEYDLDGSRVMETPIDSSQTLAHRWYYYDGLGRSRGSLYGQPREEGGEEWTNDHNCLYDAEGQMVMACSNASLVYLDGPNVVGTNTHWRFVHGPGLDDPLTGHYVGVPSDSLTVYFVTDGGGRHLAVGNWEGVLPNQTSGRSGWKESGVVRGSFGFGAVRMEAKSPGLEGLSYFRNRAYDSRTGRWTQEDPIGLAGGLNLYQFNGNNPVNYSDPFGLDPCKGKDGKETTCHVPTKEEVNRQATANANQVIALFGLAQAGWGAIRYGVAKLATSVATPYGAAGQASGAAAQALRSEVAGGRQIYRGGNFGSSTAAEGQFWAPASPLTAGYAARYGAATLGQGTPQFVVGGRVAADATFVTRAAPAVGANPGGAMEIVVPSGGVKIDFFHMP